MTHKNKLYVNLVAVLLLGLVMVVWVLTQITGSALVGAPFKVTADFAASGGVFTNQEVTYRGVLIGKVGELRLNDDGVDIDLIIDSAWRDRIPANSLAAVRSKSAVGEQFVNITPVSEAGPSLAEGDRIERSRTSLPVDFQELLASLDAVLADVSPETAKRLIGNLSSGLRGRGRDIGIILRSLGRLSDAFASVAPEQQRLIDSATTAGSEFLRTKESFAAALRAADQVFAGLGDEPEELAAFLRENDRLARAGSDLLARRGRQLAGGIEALADFTGFQLDERQSVEQGLTYTPRFLKAVEDASVPWRSPDGRTYYRIRAGLVIDNVRSSWPCKYKLPVGYERHYFVRGGRQRTVATTRCVPSSAEASARASLVAALQRWVDEHPARPSVNPLP